MAKFNWEDHPLAPPIQASQSFNWEDHPMEAAPTPTPMPISKTESLIRGVGQGATFGFEDEGAGAIEAPMGALKKAGSYVGYTPDKNDEDIRNYEAARDSERHANEAARKANPKTFMAGQVGGAILPGLITAGAGTEASLGTMAAQGAAQGAAYGLGGSNANDLEGLTKDTAIGTGMGAAGGALGYGVTKGLNALSGTAENATNAVADNLESVAENQAAKSLGATKATYNQMGADKVREIGRGALDNDILTPFNSTADKMARAQALQTAGGEGMGNVYSQIDQAGASTFNPLDVATNVEEQLAPTYRTAINKGEWTQMENTIDSILERGDGNLPLTEAQALKEEIGAVAYPKGRAPIDPTPKQQMAQDAYRIVNQAIDDAAESGSKTVGANDLLEQLQKSKSLYQSGKGAEKLLDNKINGELGNKSLGLTDTITGVGAYAMLGPKGLAVLAAKKGAEKYGNQLTALSADKLADIVRATPQVFGKWAPALQNAATRGTVALAASSYVLQQTDPGFRQKIQDLGQDNED